MSSIDQQFVEFIVKSLVSNPDDVTITRTIDEKGVLLQLEVAGDDLGRVIGKRGATAQSIRTLLRALGTKNDARYNLKIVDTGEGMPPKPQHNRDENNDRSSSYDDSSQSNSDDTSSQSGTSSYKDEDEDQQEEDNSKSYVDKHRADLDDLDDLEI